MEAIKVRDLRIGNLVVLNVGQPCKCEVASLCGGNISVCPIGGGVCESFLIENGKSNGVEPIPLTEEILLKCGFTDNGNMLSNHANSVISKDLKWIGVYNERIEDDVEYDLPESVHQLQNLIFALTGQELEVSL